MNKLESLSEIFEKSIFRIPSYQRGYSWEDEQLEEFWEDVSKLPLNRDHYTGMISLRVLDKNDDEDKEILKKWNDEHWLLYKDDESSFQAFHVVDGQQRLTTIIILITVIVDFYRKMNPGISDDKIMLDEDTSLASVVIKYLVILKPNSNIKSYLFGYEVDKPSDDYLKNKILDSDYSGDITKSLYTLNLDYAKEFFTEKIDELYKAKGDFSDIYKIYKKVTNSLKFNKYVIDKTFNVNVAFETMNNRGKRLSNLELLKNKLIYLTSLLCLPKDEENRLMLDINNTWKTIYSYLGKSLTSKLDDDDFLLAHSYVYFGFIEAVKKDYAGFLKKYFSQARIFDSVDVDSNSDSDSNQCYLEDDESDLVDTFDDINISGKLTSKTISNYINSLSELVPSWYRLHYPNYDNSELNLWLTKLKRLEFNYFRPLILVALSKNYISDDKKIELLKAIERFIFVTFRLCGFQTTYCRHIYTRFAHMLYFDNVSIDEIIAKLNDIDVLSSNNVIDMNAGFLSTVNKLFKNNGFYGWKANKYFLFEYESYLVNKVRGVSIIDANKYFNTLKISVEHIFPQSESSVYWLGVFDGFTLAERNRLRGSLGNLLPLAMDVNRDLRDSSFEVKKVRYKDGSYSEKEVYEYVDDNGVSIWNSQSILTRGLKLIEFLEDRWNVKFQCKYDKIRFLGLDFLNNEDYKYVDYIEPIYDEKDDESDLGRYERREYTLEHHLNKATDDVRNLFFELDSRIKTSFPDVMVKINQIHISYSKNNNFVNIAVKKNFLYVYVLPSDDYDDFDNKLEQIPDGYQWTLNMRMEVKTVDDIDYAMTLIKKSYGLVL